MGTRWLSPSGGLWISIILRPSENLPGLNLLPAFASLALADALQPFGIPAEIEWPNDLTFDGRKIAGILCESNVRTGITRWIIVGIGVNANNPPPPLQVPGSTYAATSMIEITSKQVDLASLSRAVRDSVLRIYNDLKNRGKLVLLRDYNARQALKGRRVRVLLHDGILEGIAGEMDGAGKLAVRTTNRKSCQIQSEDVLRVEEV